MIACTTVGLSLPVGSQASFSHTSDATMGGSADHIHRWVHLYSQSIDPDGQTGYATLLNSGSSSSTPAATGTDENVVVNLGATTVTTVKTFSRVFRLSSVAAYPVGGVTSVTLTISTQADPTTGKQPITSCGVAAWGTGTTFNTTYALNANTRIQLNLRTAFTSGGGWTTGTNYKPNVVILLKYTGFTTTYYQYTISTHITYGTGTGS
jgi:hypothetical protein